MPVTRFEELTVWQKARELNKRVYIATARGPAAKDFAFVSQARRASISAMNNVAEGFERYQRPEFLQFLSIAKGSAGELRSMFYAAVDVGYVTQDEFESLLADAENLSKSLAKFRASLERSPLPPNSKPSAVRRRQLQH